MKITQLSVMKTPQFWNIIAMGTHITVHLNGSDSLGYLGLMLMPNIILLPWTVFKIEQDQHYLMEHP